MHDRAPILRNSALEGHQQFRCNSVRLSALHASQTLEGKDNRMSYCVEEQVEAVKSAYGS